MSDQDPEAGHSSGLLRGLVWAGVLLAPLAAAVVLLAQSSGSVRFAVLLLAVSVVLIGASVLIRSDPVLQRMHVEDRVVEEVEALRARLRAESVAGAAVSEESGFFRDVPARPPPDHDLFAVPPGPSHRPPDPGSTGNGRATVPAVAAVATVRPVPAGPGRSGGWAVAGAAIPHQRGAASSAVVRTGASTGRPESLDGYRQGGGYGQGGYGKGGSVDGHGYEPTGYEPNGYEPTGYEPNGYEPTGYQQGGGYEHGSYGEGGGYGEAGRDGEVGRYGEAGRDEEAGRYGEGGGYGEAGRYGEVGVQEQGGGHGTDGDFGSGGHRSTTDDAYGPMRDDYGPADGGFIRTGGSFGPAGGGSFGSRGGGGGFGSGGGGGYGPADEAFGSGRGEDCGPAADDAYPDGAGPGRPGYDGAERSAGRPNYRARRHRPSVDDTNIGTLADFGPPGGYAGGGEEKPDERRARNEDSGRGRW